jgi:ribosome biogenesis GTPase
MHYLSGGAWLLDTPGMRELQLTDVRSGLEDVFAEITALGERCRFADCAHDGEPGCAVQQAVADDEIDTDRVKRWRKLVREAAVNSATIAERRAYDKSFGRMTKNAVSEKQAKKERGAG